VRKKEKRKKKKPQQQNIMAAPTRGRIDHFAADVIYLQFLVRVCYFSTLPKPVFQV